MKVMKKYGFVIGTITIILMAHEAFAQPDWEVNAPDYQYTMTTTGTGIINCSNTNNPEDRVAAFINGEVRGVAAFDTEINGIKLAYLTIYDNVAAGSEVSFKIYNAEDDAVIDAVENIVFSDGLIAGTQDAPYEFRDTYGIEKLVLSANNIFDFTETGDPVGELFLINEIGDTLVGNFTFVNDSLGPDNSLFNISNSMLVWQGNSNSSLPEILTLHISGSNPQGCSFDQVIFVHTHNTNEIPGGLVRDTLFVTENEAAGKLVGTLQVINATPGDAFTFSFDESGNINPDHEAFQIANDKLYTTKRLDYETQRVYHLNIRITNLSGNSISTPLVVNVIDISESVAVGLNAGNLVTPNSDGFNDTFYIPNLEIYPNYELLVYNAIGNLVFHTRDYDNMWQGYSDRGVALPTGTYYYIFQDVDNNQNRYKGDINLYRENKF